MASLCRVIRIPSYESSPMGFPLYNHLISAVDGDAVHLNTALVPSKATKTDAGSATSSNL